MKGDSVEGMQCVLTGIGGSGKTFCAEVLKKLCKQIFSGQPQSPVYKYCMCCAFTGQAASILKGETFYSALCLRADMNPDSETSENTLNELRIALENVKLIIVDGNIDLS